MAPGKGYILMTDFTTHPDAFPRIGTIIQDSLRPNERRLSEPDPEPETLTNSMKYHQITSSTLELHGDVWASFCKTVEARVGGGISHKKITTFDTKCLETKYIVRTPTEVEIHHRAQEKEVQGALNAGGALGRAVFLVTGLKIARGFKWTTKIAADRRAEAGAKGPVTDQFSAGADFGVSNNTLFEADGESNKGSENDIVFAYRLHTIASKGWWRKGERLSPHEPDGAFSSGVKRLRENHEPGVKQLRESQVLHIFPTSIKDIEHAAKQAEDTIVIETATDEALEEGKISDEKVYCVRHVADDDE